MITGTGTFGTIYLKYKILNNQRTRHILQYLQKIINKKSLIKHYKG